MRLQGKTYAWANADEYDRGWLGSKEGWDNWPYGGQKISAQNQPNPREFRPTCDQKMAFFEQVSTLSTASPTSRS